eukprot:g9525.t1
MKAPLERAAAEGKRGLVQRLVRRAGAKIGKALHGAVEGGHRDIANDLLESGASLAAKDREGYTPLHLAARQGETEMVQLLLLKGANQDAFGRARLTPLYLATYYGHLSAALALLAAGADVDLKCGLMDAPVIHTAAEKGRVDILRAVIEQGADVDAVNTIQRSALHLASSLNKTDVIDVLVEAGADLEARDRGGYTPLYVASDGVCLEAFLCLLKHGANVNAQTNALTTSLMRAAAKAGRQGAAKVVDYLLRAGADETIANGQGHRASDVIGGLVRGEHRVAEDVKRVRKLLANAPADRAWRRRGYLVLCRAHPDRLQEKQVVGGTHHTNVARRPRNRDDLVRADDSTGDNTVGAGAVGEWTVVVSKVLFLQQEDVFRTIVRHL